MKVYKKLVYVYAIAAILCAVSAILGFVQEMVWFVTVNLAVFLAISLAALAYASLIWVFRRKMYLRQCMWFVLVRITILMGVRCYYDWYVLDQYKYGLYRGIEVFIWLSMVAPSLLVIYSYLIYTSIRRRRRHDISKR